MTTLPPQLLDAIWSALKISANRPSRTDGARPLEARIHAAGWARMYEIEDLLTIHDSSLMFVNVQALPAALGFSAQAIYPRPRAIARDVMGFDAISVHDVAFLLIRLEEMGFSVDPERIVAALRPTTDAMMFLTKAQLRMLWFERFRHKRKVTFLSGREPVPDEREIRLVTQARYKVSAIVAGDAVRQLTVRGPRYREPRERVRRTCPECGYEYLAGDPESTYDHRQYHRKEMRIIRPQSEARLGTLVGEGTGSIVYVDAARPRWLHEAVYQRAVRFRREFRYDFVQYPEPGHMWAGHETVGVLFVNRDAGLPDLSIVGACAFVRRETRWRLTWVWVTPPVRRSGVLSSRWRELRERFGDFELEWPLSDAMRGFLRVHGTPGQLDGIAV